MPTGSAAPTAAAAPAEDTAPVEVSRAVVANANNNCGLRLTQLPSRRLSRKRR